MIVFPLEPGRGLMSHLALSQFAAKTVAVVSFFANTRPGTKSPASRYFGARVSLVAQLCMVVVALVLVSIARATPTFVDLGGIAGMTPSAGRAVSNDGLVVAGDYQSNGSRAFRWTQATGMQDLGLLPGATFAILTGMSADGSVISISSDQGGPYAIAVRWTVGQGQQNLGYLPGGSWALGTSVSADGSTLVGMADASPGPAVQAIRWQTVGGLQSLGTVEGAVSSEGFGASADGSVIVGRGQTGSRVEAMRWTALAGFESLGVAAATHNYSEFFAASADGLVAVGGSGPTQQTTRAMIWTSTGGMEDLGMLPVGTFAQLRSVCASGVTAVGWAGTTSNSRAVLWNRELGLVDLNAYLPTLGIDLTGWTLRRCDGISADGSAITGTGSFGGQNRAYLVRGLTDLCGPRFLTQPISATACESRQSTFSVSVTGAGNLYQWQFEESPGQWVDLTGSSESFPCNHIRAVNPTSSTTFIDAQPDTCTGATQFQVRCRVSDSNGETNSLPATLSVVPTGSADGDGSGAVDGRDVQVMVNLLVTPELPSPFDCALDMDADGSVDVTDVTLFVERLIAP